MTKKQPQQIQIYQAENGALEIQVDQKQDTIWLTQNQIAILFDKERSVITKHLSKIFKDFEVDKKAMCKKCTFLILINQ